MLVKLLTGKHRVGDRVYHPGEVFEVTAGELEAFGDKLQLLQIDGQKSLSDSETKPSKAKRG